MKIEIETGYIGTVRVTDYFISGFLDNGESFFNIEGLQKNQLFHLFFLILNHPQIDAMAEFLKITSDFMMMQQALAGQEARH